jgi:hypothetical protein
MGRVWAKASDKGAITTARAAAHAKMIDLNGPDWRFINRLPIYAGLEPDTSRFSNRSGE